MQRIFKFNTGWVWDEYDGRAEVLPWYSNQSMQRGSLCSSVKIYKEAHEQIQARWLQDHYNSNASNMQYE